MMDKQLAAVSAYTQVKMVDHVKIAQNSKFRVSCFWIGIEDPVVLQERNLYGHPLAGLSCERQFGFFSAILRSSTYTDKKNPCSRCTNKHSQFGTFSHPTRIWHPCEEEIDEEC